MRFSARMLSMSLGVVVIVTLADAGHAQITVGKTIRLTNRITVQRSPSISGDIVVWKDERNGISDIYGYNLATGEEFPIATGGRNKGTPDIDGSVVVWGTSNASGRMIVGKDLATGNEFTVASGYAGYLGYSSVSVMGRKVYYSYLTTSDCMIYEYDIDSGTNTRITPDDGDYYADPHAKDNQLVWYKSPRAYHLDLDTGVTTTISASGLDLAEPKVAVDRVYFAANGSRIESYHIPTASFMTITTGRLTHPSADGSLAVWTDWSNWTVENPVASIHGIDISTGQYFEVVDDPDIMVDISQRQVEIDGMRVVWTRKWDHTNYDIYVTELVPEPATLSLLVLGGLALIRRRRK